MIKEGKNREAKKNHKTKKNHADGEWVDGRNSELTAHPSFRVSEQTASHMDGWQDIAAAWINGYFTATYFNEQNTIHSYDRDRRTIELGYNLYYPEAYLDEKRPEQIGKYYFENVPEEMDFPGECYVDAESGYMFFIPPAYGEPGDLSIPKLEANEMLNVEKASWIAFGGIAPDPRYGAYGNNPYLGYDPGFADYESGDVQLSKEAAAGLGIEWVDLSQIGAKPRVRLIGDINGDGMANSADLSVLWQIGNYNKSLKPDEDGREGADPWCDLNGDKAVNSTDLAVLWRPENYNKGEGRLKEGLLTLLLKQPNQNCSQKPRIIHPIA